MMTAKSPPSFLKFLYFSRPLEHVQLWIIIPDSVTNSNFTQLLKKNSLTIPLELTILNSSLMPIYNPQESTAKS